jgi:catechol 2,3-dioxygenase-like lactoylglutathione lyase family enzyme
MAVLRYIAYLSDDPEKLTGFYHRFLGTEELGRSVDGDVSITDGFYNLTFFKRRAQLNELKMDCGLHHVGLEVVDLEETKGRFLALYPRGMILQEADDIHHGEIRIHDPECFPVSLSTKRFGVPLEKGKEVSARSTHRLQRFGSGDDVAVLQPSAWAPRGALELPAPAARPRQPVLRRRPNQFSHTSVLQSHRRPPG